LNIWLDNEAAEKI